MNRMEKTFTPIDIAKLEQRFKGVTIDKKEPKSGFDSKLNTVLISLATLTALVLSIVLFVLIQQQLGNTRL